MLDKRGTRLSVKGTDLPGQIRSNGIKMENRHAGSRNECPESKTQKKRKRQYRRCPGGHLSGCCLSSSQLNLPTSVDSEYRREASYSCDVELSSSEIYSVFSFCDSFLLCFRGVNTCCILLKERPKRRPPPRLSASELSFLSPGSSAMMDARVCSSSSLGRRNGVLGAPSELLDEPENVLSQMN